MKLGIVGSRKYANPAKVRRVIEKYIQQYGSKNLTIVSGGCPDGGDAIAKKLALDMGLEYKEFPPAHAKHNSFCVLPKSEYNKSYQVANYFTRNTQIAEFCDHIAAFIVSGIKANGTMDTVGKAYDLGKPAIVFEDKPNENDSACKSACDKS